MAITISENAAAKIRSLLADRNQPEAGLRVKVVGGGCSGLQYKMDLDVERPGDKVFGTPDAKILVDRKSFLYLERHRAGLQRRPDAVRVQPAQPERQKVVRLWRLIHRVGRD